MSAIGTGVAASVAQVGLQAQQVARQQDKNKTRRAQDATRIQELIESHLRALDEGDEAQTSSQLHIDEQLPQHHHPEALDTLEAPEADVAVPSNLPDSLNSQENAQLTDSSDRQSSQHNGQFPGEQAQVDQPAIADQETADEQFNALYQHLDVQA